MGKARAVGASESWGLVEDARSGGEREEGTSRRVKLSTARKVGLFAITFRSGRTHELRNPRVAQTSGSTEVLALRSEYVLRGVPKSCGLVLRRVRRALHR